MHDMLEDIEKMFTDNSYSTEDALAAVATLDSIKCRVAHIERIIRRTAPNHTVTIHISGIDDTIVQMSVLDIPKLLKEAKASGRQR